MLSSANRGAAGRSRFGADSGSGSAEFKVSDGENAAVATSTSGLAHTSMEIPGAPKSSSWPLIIGALAAVGVLVGVYVTAGKGEVAEGEPEPIVVSTPAKEAVAADAVESGAAMPPAVVAEPLAEAEEEPDETEMVEPPPEPQAAAPVPAPVRAPAPRPQARPATKPATASAPIAPAPSVAPAPAPAPRPLSAPKPKRVNLGI